MSKKRKNPFEEYEKRRDARAEINMLARKKRDPNLINVEDDLRRYVLQHTRTRQRRWDLYNEHVKPLDQELVEIEDAQNRLLRRFFGVAKIDLGFYDCVASPIGLCVYDGMADPSHDNCLVCGDPSERK
jgi:hypothetical protein